MSAMRWSDLPRGVFTGIDWGRPHTADGFDPYLVWAEADRFAGCGLSAAPAWLPLAIELEAATSVADFVKAASPAWLRVPGVYLSAAAPAGLRFCTARVRPEFFVQLRPGGRMHEHMRRLELGLPAGPHTGELALAPATTTPSGAPLLDGTVAGLIDGGLAFAHANFMDAGGTRIRHLWRQDEAGVGDVPKAMGYGHEVDAARIDAACRRHTFGGLVDEDAVYREFSSGMELNKRVNHGTHVLDMACGPRTVRAQIAGVPPAYDAPPSWAMASDVASRCPIVAVQLDWDTVRDTSGGSMNVHILDGLLYILSKCAPTARVVVNLSWGTLAGPHDGTALLEAAMDQLIALSQGRLHIVLPASNSYQARTHANVTLRKGERTALKWRGLPADSTQSFLELWLPAGAQQLTLQITPPGHPPLPALRWGEAKQWTAEGDRPRCAVIYPRSVATGTNGTCALVALAPTFGFAADAPLAPHGVWRIELANEGAAAVTVDAYIERDDEIIGVRTGAQQSFFEDERYDTSGNPGAFVDDPDNPCPVRRSGSFNSIATGRETLSVGGTRVRGDRWARYSPREPDPDASRPERPGVVKVPQTCAPSDEDGVLVGLRGAGSRSGGVVRLVGTSDAAPQVARDLLNSVGAASATSAPAASSSA